MRPQLEIALSSDIIHFSPPHPPAATSCDPHAHGCRWWPYFNYNDFGANTAMVLIILLCSLICALAFNTTIHCFLSRGHRLPQTRLELDDEHLKPNTVSGNALLAVAPMLTYSTGMKLSGAEANCAIFLFEFVEGEGIRILGTYKHGFHVHCIESWLFSHSSCPTCCESCLVPETTGLNKTFRQSAIERALVEST